MAKFPLDEERTVESTNLEVTKTYCEQSQEQREAVSAGAMHLWQTLMQTLTTLRNALELYSASSTQTQEQNKQLLENVIQTFVNITSQMKSVSAESQSTVGRSCGESTRAVAEALAQHSGRLPGALRQLAGGAHLQQQQRARELRPHHHLAAFARDWHSGAGARVRSLQRAHGAMWQEAGEARASRTATQRALHDQLRTHAKRKITQIDNWMMEIQQNSAQLQQLVTDIHSEIENERQDLEERLAKIVEMDRNALEVRLAKLMSKVAELQKVLEQNNHKYKELYELRLQAEKEEFEMADEYLEKCETFEEDHSKHMKKYQTEFEEGTNAISVDMEVCSKNVLEVVEHLYNQVLQILDETKTQMKQQVDTIIVENENSCNQITELVDETLVNVVNVTKNTMDECINKIETSTNTAVQDLSAVSSSTCELISTTHSFCAQHEDLGRQARAKAQVLRELLREALEQLAALEARYLQQEYKVYSPTDK